jgi:4-aminobutyrate aminotransferase
MDRDTVEPVVEDMPGDKAAEWAEYHHEHAAKSTYVYEFVWDVTEESIGPFCTDVDGNVLLDFTSHVAAAPLGYNNPKVTEKLAELGPVEPSKIAGQDFYTSGGWPPEDAEFPGPAQLMDRITDITDHYDLDTVFLSNSGAEAVENALKLCFDRTGGTRGVTFEGAFHGRTLGALSLNRSKHNHRKRYPELSGITDVPYCRDSDCSPGSCVCGFFPGGEDDPSILRRKLDPDRGHLPAEDVAFVILEPIQGEGGYQFPSQEFASEVNDICKTHDIPLIVDEIQAGLGRTGEYWGADHYDFEPDVITSAKGLRVGATVANEDTFPDEKARISSTWGAGDVVASMQGVLTLEAIEEHDLLDNATERGTQFMEHLEDAELPNVVDVRGKGLMIAVEFDSKEHREAVVEACLERGLLVLGCGYKTIRLLPPLDVTAREIDIGAELFVEAARDVAGVKPEATIEAGDLD